MLQHKTKDQMLQTRKAQHTTQHWVPTYRNGAIQPLNVC